MTFPGRHTYSGYEDNTAVLELPNKRPCGQLEYKQRPHTSQHTNLWFSIRYILMKLAVYPNVS